MEQMKNHRSVDSQSIWLKSARSKANWLDLKNPWLKEVIKSDPELIFCILYGEFHPASLLHTFLAHLDEFWWMLQWTGWGVSQISSLIDSCTQWDSDLTQLDIDRALIKSPSVDFTWFHEELHPPLSRWPVFCIYPGTTSSSKLVRIGIEVLLLFYCCYSSFEIKKSFGGKMVWCHCMCGWL